jgi:hypothetical protein
MRRPLRPLLFALLLVPLAPSEARADKAHAAECGDAYTRAQTLRRDRKLIDARDALRICAQPVCKDFIVKDCTTWLDQVQSSVPTVVPVATDPDGNNLPGVRVSMDGHLLLESIDGRSIEVDPGTHTFSFEAPDGRKAEKETVGAEGEKSKHVAVVFERPPAAPVASPIAGATPSSPPAPPVATTSASPSDSHGSPWKTVGIVTTVVGGAGLAAGAIFGLEAMSKKSDAGCSSNQCSGGSAREDIQSARSDGNLSTAFFIAGGVLAAAGLTLWALAPGSVQATPAVGSNTAGVVVRGAW